MLSIPEYYAKFIDPSIDLNRTPKICCPFHKEDTPSFSYSAEKGRWRCFGACKFGGDVISLHQKNFHLNSRREAEESLYKLLGIRREQTLRKPDPPKPDLEAAAAATAFAKASLVATTPDDWDELDYIMSQYPPEVDKLEAFYNCRRAV